MTTERQVQSNRRNALRSTGPKTEAGKTKVAHNALRHGLRTDIFKDTAWQARPKQVAELIFGGPDYTPETFAYAILYTDLDRVGRVKERLLAELSEASGSPNQTSLGDLERVLAALRSVYGYERKLRSRLKKAAKALLPAAPARLAA